jgi:hypothetical protein
MRTAIPISSALLWCVVGVVLLRGIALNSGFFHDDAYITLRYAQNFLAGDGIGWNPGDRVEGYTNFLQLLAVSGLGALGVDLVSATRGIAFASYAALLAFLVGWSRSQLLPPGARSFLLGSLTVAGVASSLPLLAWGFGGLEAPLLSLGVTIGIALLHDVLNGERPPEVAAASGVALALACLTRPDAGLFAAAGAVCLGASLRGAERRRGMLLFSLPLVFLLAPWLLWKLSYYGSILPNTFYAKATDPSWQRGVAGFRYLASYLAAPPFVFLLLAAGAARAQAVRGLRPGQRFAGICLILHLCWVMYVGGDQMPMHRLLVPVIPTAVWLAVSLWRPDLRRLSDPLLACLAAGVAACIALQLAVGDTRLRHLNSTEFVGTAVGRYIANAWPAGSLVALNTAGSTPFHAPGLRYLDMLGLNDAHIARRESSKPRIRGQLLPGHAKGDGAYVLRQRPDFIVLGPANGVTANQPWFLSDLEIAEAADFHRDYELGRARLDVAGLAGSAHRPEARSGQIAFTWYQRRDGTGARDRVGEGRSSQ